MKKRFLQFVLLALAAVTLALAGCGDSNETKGKQLLSQAETLIQQDKAVQAEQILKDLVAKYPETESGKEAVKQLNLFQQQRDQRLQEGLAKTIASYQQVLDGYHSVYAEYPPTKTAFDQSGYFFDSAYLEEVLPAATKAYLWLKSDGSGYQVWCVAQENDRGLTIASLDHKVLPFVHAELLEQIKTRFEPVAENGKLVVLQSKI